MAMTEAVKDELGRLSISKPCCRKAEVSSILRFAGGLHIAAGKIIIEVELDAAQSARRLRKDIAEIFGHESELSVVSSSGIRKGSRYIVRVLVDGDALARQTGLVDANNRPIRGLPPQVVSAAICDSEAAWRGAFLAHGSLTEQAAHQHLKLPVQDLKLL
jgi:DNA-binding protein WhiA